jgi:hypothetical protein
MKNKKEWAILVFVLLQLFLLYAGIHAIAEGIGIAKSYDEEAEYDEGGGIVTLITLVDGGLILWLLRHFEGAIRKSEAEKETLKWERLVRLEKHKIQTKYDEIVSGLNKAIYKQMHQVLDEKSLRRIHEITERKVGEELDRRELTAD